MNKIKNTLFVLSVLSLCALIATDAFGGERGLKRKRSDEDQEQKQEITFHEYSLLPNELQRHIISTTDLYSLENLVQVSKQTRSDVQSVSQLYIGSAQKHASQMSLLKDELHERGVDSKMGKIAFRDTGRRLATINHHIEMAQLNHDSREYSLSVSHSREALIIPIPQMPHDKMMIDGI